MNIDNMIKDNKGIVWQVINDLQYVPESVEEEDLFQIGLISLWGAIESYQEDNGYALSTHCYKLVYGDIIDYLRREQAQKRNGHIDLPTKVESFEDDVIASLIIDEIDDLLSSNNFDIFNSIYIDNSTIQETSNDLDMSSRTVSRRIRDIKNTLQEQLMWD